MEGENGVVGKHCLERDIHKYTWTSPDGRTRNQIDHIAVNGIFRRSVPGRQGFQGSRRRNLVVGNILLKLSGKVRNHGEITARKYELSKLKVAEIKQRLVLEVENRFSCLAETEPNGTGNDDTQNVEGVEEKWLNIKKSLQRNCKVSSWS